MWNPIEAVSQRVLRAWRRLFPPYTMPELIATKIELELALDIARPHEREILNDFVEASRLGGLKAPRTSERIATAVLVRIIMARVMPMPELVRYVQHLQGRYESAVGPSVYARYLAQVPKDVFLDYAKLCAELRTLSYRLRLVYAVTFKRDQTLSVIRFLCFWVLAAALLFALFTIMWEDRAGISPPSLNCVLVAVVGLGGAVTSILRRANQILDAGPLSEDPIQQASALENGGASLVVAAITGPVFALMLLALFMSGVFVDLGPLTPKFDTGHYVEAVRQAAQVKPPWNPVFTLFDFAFRPKSGLDAAKLIVWSFVAGFAEQLVPDMLDQFGNAGKRKKS